MRRLRIRSRTIAPPARPTARSSHGAIVFIRGGIARVGKGAFVARDTAVGCDVIVATDVALTIGALVAAGAAVALSAASGWLIGAAVGTATVAEVGALVGRTAPLLATGCGVAWT